MNVRILMAMVIFTGIFLGACAEDAKLKKVGNPGGQPDLSFGVDGMATVTAIPGNEKTFDAFRLDGQGRYVLAGSLNPGVAAWDGFVMRLLDTAELDISFNGTGYHQRNNDGGSNGNDRMFGLALEPGGNILVTGHSFGPSIHRGVIWRFTDAGALDPAWNGSGVRLWSSNVNNQADFISPMGVFVQPDGNVLVGGRAPISGGSGHEAYVMRFTAGGTPDTGFTGTAVIDGSNVWALTPNAGTDLIVRFAVDAGGRIYAVGQSGNPANLLLVRFNADGTVDSTFDSAGPTPGMILSPMAGTAATGNDIKLDSAGNVLVSGCITITPSTTCDAVVWRFLPDGTLDPAFGGGLGYIPVDASGVGNNDYGREFELDALGRIVLAVYVESPDQAGTGVQVDVGVVRIRANGTLDTGFGDMGVVLLDSTPAGGPDTNDVAQLLELDALGRIVLAGSVRPAGGLQSPALWRLLP